MASTRALRFAPWSSSKIQMALRCPKEFYFRYVERRAEQVPSLEARVGTAVHAVIEAVLKGELLPLAIEDARAQLEDREYPRFDRLVEGVGPFVERVRSTHRKRRVRRELIEYSLAVTEQFAPTTFYGPRAFFRGVVDVGYLYADSTLAILDHKTGVRLPLPRFTDQLHGYAVLGAAAFRGMSTLWIGVHWVKDREVEWAPPMIVGDVLDRLISDLRHNIEAAALAVADGPRPSPSDWCHHCPYRTICPAADDERFEPVEYEPEPWES